jgi:hypothetical protein
MKKLLVSAAAVFALLGPTAMSASAGTLGDVLSNLAGNYMGNGALGYGAPGLAGGNGILSGLLGNNLGSPMYDQYGNIIGNAGYDPYAAGYDPYAAGYPTGYPGVNPVAPYGYAGAPYGPAYSPVANPIGFGQNYYPTAGYGSSCASGAGYQNQNYGYQHHHHRRHYGGR